MSSFSALDPWETNAVQADQEISATRSTSPGTLSRLKRSLSSERETSPPAERPLSRIEALPNELLETIVEQAIPRGSGQQRNEALTRMALASPRLRDITTYRFTPRLHGLMALRIADPRFRYEDEDGQEHVEGIFDYARRLKIIHPTLTPEQACFVAYDRQFSNVEEALRNSLEFQPPEVQTMIVKLTDEHWMGENEAGMHYALRLKREVDSGLTAKHACIAGYGYAFPSAVRELSQYLEFQTPEVQTEIANLRTRHPRTNQDIDDAAYAMRLTVDHGIPEEDASLAALGQRGTYSPEAPEEDHYED